MKLCRPLRSVCLFSLFSHEREEFVLAWKSANESSRQIKMSSQKLHYAPLKMQVLFHSVSVSGDHVLSANCQSNQCFRSVLCTQNDTFVHN